MARVGDITIPDEMLKDAQAIKRQGGMVYLVRPDIQPGVTREGIRLCANCNGVGVLASFISPYRTTRDWVSGKVTNFIEVFKKQIQVI